MIYPIKVIRIPARIKILGLVYEIICNRDITYQADSYGIFHSKTQKIFIDPDSMITDEKRAETLLHEILHCLFTVMGLDEAIKSGKATEEQLAIALASGLNAVFVDNPQLFNWEGGEK